MVSVYHNIEIPFSQPSPPLSLSSTLKNRYSTEVKIAQIAPVIERVPPPAYGGTERIVSALTDHLVSLGHDVTLFATADSLTKAKLSAIVPRPLREIKVEDLYGPNQWSLLHYGFAYSRQSDFDIIHDHNSYLSLPIANIARTPVVLTMHGSITPLNKRMYETLPRPYLVAISESQTQTMANLNFVGTVHNGLDMTDYEFSNTHDNYLLYVGRISQEKGVHWAIEAAEFLNLPLILAAKVDEKDRPYFNRYIRPRLDSKLINWVGEVNQQRRNQLMSRAMALLHPVTWREPFGLTLIESMATGCPVVAFNRGSISEIVVDGVTGFTVDDLGGMVEAIKNIAFISRADCRYHALTNFSARRMAIRYEEIYYQILTEKLVRQRGVGEMLKWKGGTYSTAHDLKKPRKKV
jgi:glycosyltransferase involved in cell wall biosynthesis